MVEFLTLHNALIIFVGYFIGIMGVMIGGGMFFSAPFLQSMFPGASFGAIVGNIKVGSFFRSIGSTAVTFKQIDFFDCVKVSGVMFLGTILGASSIAHLDQRWLFPAIIIAIILAVLAPKIASRVTNKTFHGASFFTGAYTGFFGAGSGVMMIALLRLKHPEDHNIAHVKIQSRFIESLLVVVAIGTHFYHGNIIASIWIPWSIGAIFGGFTGGWMLNKLGSFSGHTQRNVLYVAFAFALIVSGAKFFELY